MLGKVGILLFYFILFFFEGGVKIYSVFVRIDVMYRVINGLNLSIIPFVSAVPVETLKQLHSPLFTGKKGELFSQGRT